MPFRSYSFVTALAAALAIVGFTAGPAVASVGVTINGSAVDISPQPITQAGRVFVPLRGVFEQLGASVVYENGEINATGNGRNISLHIGSTQAAVDGQPQTIDVAPFIVGASTYVPLRFISEALGASVDWDDASSTVAISLAGAPQTEAAPENAPDDGSYADEAPPPIPQYDQPPVPDPNEIWQPGYWAWGSNGYYWVPGTWVAPPQTGYLWTPGYWQARDRGYGWNPGFWATAVGFYGGVNYGAGYYGNGYVGGRWSQNVFRYNTSVTHVNTTVIRNVYVDRTVIDNDTSTRVGYNGGPRGERARPTSDQLTVEHGHRYAMTPVQQQHVQAAANDRRFLATVNHDQPPVAAVARPLSPAKRAAGFTPVTAADRVAPPVRTVPAPAAPRAVPPERERPLQQAPPAHVAPQAPPVRVAPEHVAPPPVRVAPPPVHVAPPPVHVAPPPVHVAPPPRANPPAEERKAPPPADTKPDGPKPPPDHP